MWQGFIKMKNIKIIRKTRFQKEISQQYIYGVYLRPQWSMDTGKY